MPVRERPFVGRERELGRLREAFEAAIAGQGSVVAIAGEPGIGKTRLVEEFERSREAEVIRHIAVGKTHMPATTESSMRHVRTPACGSKASVPHAPRGRHDRSE